MLPEALTLFACLHGSGCAETASMYRLYNPVPFKQAEQYTDQFNRMFFTQYWAPVVGYAMGREGTIKLHKHVGLNLSQKQTKILLSFDF